MQIVSRPMTRCSSEQTSCYRLSDSQTRERAVADAAVDVVADVEADVVELRVVDLAAQEEVLDGVLLVVVARCSADVDAELLEVVVASAAEAEDK